MPARREPAERGEPSAATVLAATLGIYLAASAVFLPPRDGEFGWQRFLADTILRTHALPRALGDESLTAAGAPWIPQEWAFALLVRAATASDTGYILLAALVASAAAGSLLIAASTARRLGAGGGAVAVLVAAAGLDLLSAFSLRAQMLVWPLVALLVRWIVLPGRAWRLVPLALVWANLHGSAVLVPVLSAVAAGGAACDAGRIDAEARRLVLVALASVAAICVTPLGTGLWSLALGLETSALHPYISEWLVPAIDHPAVAAFVAVTIGAAIVGVPAGLRVALPAAAFALLAYSASRDISLGGIAFVTYLAPRLPRVGLRPARALEFASVPAPDGPGVAARWALAAGVVAASFALPFAGVHPARWWAVSPPIAAVEALPGRHALFCSDFARCGDALADPRVRVFTDGRADAYPLAVWTDAQRAIDLAPGWQEMLNSRGVDTIEVVRGEPLDRGLALTAGWRRTWHDRKSAVWIREDGG